MKRIIKFEKEDCTPCVMVSRFLQSAEATFEAVNPFNQPELACRYKVRTVPTTILIEEEKELMRSIGFRPEELTQLVQAARG